MLVLFYKDYLEFVTLQCLFGDPSFNHDVLIGRKHVTKSSKKAFKATIAMSEDFPMKVKNIFTYFTVAPIKLTFEQSYVYLKFL